jgi:hypothetical protein
MEHMKSFNKLVFTKLISNTMPLETTSDLVIFVGPQIHLWDSNEYMHNGNNTTLRPWKEVL